MVTKTFPVTHYVVVPPRPGYQIVAPQPPSPLYAAIECSGPAGEKMRLEYLRPDTVQPFDPPSAGTPVSNRYDVATDTATVYRMPYEFGWDQEVLASMVQVFALVDDAYPGGMTIFAPVTLLAQTSNPVPDVLQWLAGRPEIASAIRWGNPGAATLTRFPDWTQQQQQELANAFAAAWNAVPGTLPDPPPNVTGDPQNIVISVAHAWGLYLEHVAQSLSLEIGQRVPWSLAQLSPDDRLRVLSAREIFFGSVAGGYRLPSVTVPASPLFVHSFLRQNGLVGASRLETIARVLGWCRRSMRHFLDDPDWAQTYWHYDGIPVRRVIEGTVATKFPQYGPRHWTFGCSGTSDFLRSVLRVLNIPAQRATAGLHTTCWFTSEGRWLSHGDDPYDLGGLCTPPVSTSQLLIDQATFERWFGANVPPADRNANVGRRPAELAVQFLPDILLHEHWLDTQAGRTPATSRVYTRYLKSYFPDINQILFVWPALDAKLAMYGRVGIPRFTPPPLRSLERFIRVTLPEILRTMPLPLPPRR